MKSTYLRGFSTRTTPQSEAIPGQAQVQNSAGGFVYALDQWKTFERFLILGTEGGTYYVAEKPLTRDAALNTMACIDADGNRAVDLIVNISDKGRAPKNDPAIFALALASAAKDIDTRAYALSQLKRVCRIPTHLFHFNTYVEQFRGRGRSLNKAIRNWYEDTPVEKLAYEMVKYQQRDGWSHRDILRLTKPKTTDNARNALYRWAVGKSEGNATYLPPIAVAFGNAHADGVSTRDLVTMIREYNLSREMLPTKALTYPEVWDALLERMPYTAMIRNLGNMSKTGLLVPMSAASKTVVERLHDQDALKRARIHPIGVLTALKIYQQGHGLKGGGKWTPVPAVVDALNDAFYLSFSMIEPTGKRYLFGVDVSGSMEWGAIAGSPLMPAEGAAAMALACAKVEAEYYIMGFATRFRDLGITPQMRLDQVLKRTTRMVFGGTDASLPMQWALDHKVGADVFVVITDNETWTGSIHPSQALRQYREQMGINAKEAVIGMTTTNFTIADPLDSRTLDVVGFDAATPQVIAEFAGA